jgi:hypothetical protein
MEFSAEIATRALMNGSHHGTSYYLALGEATEPTHAHEAFIGAPAVYLTNPMKNLASFASLS